MLDHNGSLAGACSLAALAALLSFRRPEVSVAPDTGRVVVHPPEVCAQPAPQPATWWPGPRAPPPRPPDRMPAFRRTPTPRALQKPAAKTRVQMKEPIPLSLHHLPVAIEFALFEPDGAFVAMDPSAAEEAAAGGSITVTLNQARGFLYFF